MARRNLLAILLGVAASLGVSLLAWALPTCWDCFNFRCKTSPAYEYRYCVSGGGPGSEYCVASGVCRYY